MECPKCRFDNREEAKFCNKCGYRFYVACPECGQIDPPESNFCSECGCNLEFAKEASNAISDAEDLSQPPRSEKSAMDIAAKVGERKHVTALFSDLAGYTALSERLDPEEVKEITSRIFGEISKIVNKYEGFIEKYVGDAVMALFGATVSHEDDPVRAINAAREIHNFVDSISPQYEERIEQSLSMHTGINTGLVVTGDINFEKGTHGVAGDTVNVAARLSGLGNVGDILVSWDTYIQSEGYFDFEDLGHSKIKGKAEAISVYKVLKIRNKPSKIHRLHGLRAEMIGRKVEMYLLHEATQRLKDGKGSILSICGTAGTGKSRLVEEFQSSLNLKEVQWVEGYAYPFTQNMSYYPLINLLNRSLRIEDADSAEIVRRKIETGLSNLIGNDSEFIQIIGSLYALGFPEIDTIDPEYWKPQLQRAVQIILSALAQQAPTIVCLEDLHWADPSFLELIRLLLSECRDPILFICTYRPVVSLFSGHQIRSMVNPYQEIRLQDLSPSESQVMLESLLKTKSIPAELKKFVKDKVEGNPFYVEEMINSLIESETLVGNGDVWRVKRPITESEISSTIHGVIASRLDRLEKEAKQIIQEASVIGRAFLYKILKQITKLQDNVDKSLSDYERLDLIRTQSVQPDIEYVFKHALTHEVVYNGLLKKERRKIHGRIGLVMEQLFADRLAEFYETLAFHFTQAQSIEKAVKYLIKSGEKSLRRYAVEESHKYYKEAFNLLIEKPDISVEEKELLIDILIKWAYVFYYQGDFKTLVKLFSQNELLAKSLSDITKQGFFLAWFGMALWIRKKYRKSESYLRQALEVGKSAGDQKLIGYASCWLSLTCSDLGLFNEALELAANSHEIARLLESDHYLYFKSLNAKSQAYYCMGYVNENYDIGRLLLDYGKKQSNIRSLVLGNFSMALGYSAAGRYNSAIESCKQAIKSSEDPFYSMFPKPLMAFNYLQIGKFKEAEKIGNEALSFSQKHGCEMQGSLSSAILALVLIANGKMAAGLKQLKEIIQQIQETENKAIFPMGEYILGKIYFQISMREGPISLPTIIKNAGFLIKIMPIAGKLAEHHFNKAIEIASEIGAKGILGQTYFDLGLLHKDKKRKEKAKKCIFKAVKIFEQCQADEYLKQANNALESLK